MLKVQTWQPRTSCATAFARARWDVSESFMCEQLKINYINDARAVQMRAGCAYASFELVNYRRITFEESNRGVRARAQWSRIPSARAQCFSSFFRAVLWENNDFRRFFVFFVFEITECAPIFFVCFWFRFFSVTWCALGFSGIIPISKLFFFVPKSALKITSWLN